MSDTDSSATAAFDTEGTLTLFGFEPRPAMVSLLPRPRSWRVGGAVRIMATGAVIAPIIGLVPPHAPWVLGALGTGAFLARRRWSEHMTVTGVTGECPRCGGAVKVRPGRLRVPHPVPCEGCHHEVSMNLPPGTLPPRA